MKAFSMLFVVAVVLLAFSCGQESAPTMPANLNQTQAHTQMNNSSSQSSTPNQTILPSQGQGAEHHSEQIVFSGTGNSDLGFFGFWIWSQDEDANSPEYAGEAAGAIYLYDLGITSGVEGEVEETSEGIYEVTVESRLPDGIAATLVNTSEPVHGPHNTINVHFTSPSTGDGTSTNAVVNITGPED